jgi:hypothetical protein
MVSLKFKQGVIGEDEVVKSVILKHLISPKEFPQKIGWRDSGQHMVTNMTIQNLNSLIRILISPLSVQFTVSFSKLLKVIKMAGVVQDVPN